jgi:hypothetical protein
VICCLFSLLSRDNEAQALKPNARRATKTDFANVTLFDPQDNSFRCNRSITSVINFSVSNN